VPQFSPPTFLARSLLMHVAVDVDKE
jgi:hypothetical protein